MKEAFLLGLLSMAAGTDDNQIELQQVVKPVTVTVNGEQVLTKQIDYKYAITAKDTKTDVAPHIVRHITHNS